MEERGKDEGEEEERRGREWRDRRGEEEGEWGRRKEREKKARVNEREKKKTNKKHITGSPYRKDYIVSQNILTHTTHACSSRTSREGLTKHRKRGSTISLVPFCLEDDAVIHVFLQPLQGVAGSLTLNHHHPPSLHTLT